MSFQVTGNIDYKRHSLSVSWRPPILHFMNTNLSITMKMKCFILWWVFTHPYSISLNTESDGENQTVLLVGLIMFDSHVDAANQIQIEVNIGRKSGVKGLIKGKARR